MCRADGNPINVLVVDDEAVLAEMVSMALRYEGWNIATAGDGSAALAAARAQRPDVVVLDVMLPDMSGLDVLHKLREENPQLPVLLLTAKESVEDRIAGLTAGGDDYVTKPFSIEEVVLRLRALLRRTGVTTLDSGAQLIVGDLVLDEDSHEVTRGGQPIALTSTEFELLRFMMRNAKRVRIGDRIEFGADVAAIAAERGEDGSILLDFEGEEPVELLLERAGRMPLPPYIAGRRPADARDLDDYQTMFAKEKGAVAAPTAALHFTPGLMAALGEAGIASETLTLHVGAGTFLPVKADDTDDHRMHAEWGRIDAATADRLNAVRAGGGRVIAVGTTILRLLESAAGTDGLIRPFDGDTAIFITPGYRFRAIDGLMTNFHLPKSTLFMLVSALMGRERMQAAYRHAIGEGYRFYSYGDASLLLPGG